MEEINFFEKWAEENCAQVDELAKETFEFGSPEYNFQQGCIESCRIYRESKLSGKKKLVLEVNKAMIAHDDTAINGVLITPPIDENYWAFRVKLHDDQAILGFPKFTTIGIGFAQEENWNTNLPYSCEAKEIFKHIKHNKKYNEITDAMCIEAIQMIQQCVTKLKGN